MVSLRFSKLYQLASLLLLALPLPVRAQTVVRAGTQGTAWAATTFCSNGSFVTATPDNLHVFQAIQAGTGTTGATQPVWNTAAGALTADGTCSWKESGPSGLGGSSSGGGGGGAPPGGPLNAVQLNNNPNFAGSAAFSFDPNTSELFLQPLGAATPLLNADSPKWHLRANYWDGAQSAVDDWWLQTFTRPNGGASTTRSFIKLLHSGTSGSANGSNYTFFFDPLNLGVDCGHEDPLFTTNPVTCFAINGSNTTGSGADLSLRNGAVSGSQRTRIVQAASGGFVHYMETDPNTTGNPEFGLLGCIPLNCYPYLFSTFSGNLPELYLGGYALNPAKAAVRFDVDNSAGVTLRRSFVPLIPVDFDPTVAYLISGKEVSAPSTPAATFEKLYFEATYGACSKDSTGRERCTGGSPSAGTYELVGTFGSCSQLPTASKSGFCFGPGGEIQASFNGDALDGLVRKSNIPAAGITGLIDILQMNTSELDARYVPINSIPQNVVPEGGATGAGLQPSPIVDNTGTSGLVNVNASLAAGVGIPNCSSTGTTVALLAKYDYANQCLKTVTTSDTGIPVVLITNESTGTSPATTGTTWPLAAGIGQCTFPAATTGGDYVGVSDSVAGNCKDLGSNYAAIPSGTFCLGNVLSTNGSGGNYNVLIGSCNLTPAGGANAMVNNGANTMTSAGTIDASGQTGTNSFKVPVKSGLTTTANGAVGYDTANGNLHAGNANADAIVPVTTVTPTDANCVKWVVSSGKFKLGDSGAACGGGGGGGATGGTGYSFTGGGVTAGPTAINNTTRVWTESLGVGITGVTKVIIDVTTAATGTDTYDVGFYDVTGATLVCHTGASLASALGLNGTGQKTLTFSSCNMPAGQYYFAWTASIAGTAAVLGGVSNSNSNRCNVAPDTGSATSGGALNSAITVTTFSPTNCTMPYLGISQ